MKKGKFKEKFELCRHCKLPYLKIHSTIYFCSTKCNLLSSIFVNNFGCWIWTKAIGLDGYGRMRVNKKYVRAHRCSFEIFKAPIENNLHVLHICDERKCINPQHLILGTNAENQNDMDKKGRRKIWIKYSKEQVNKIKQLRSQGWTQQKTADLIGCSRALVYLIERNKNRTKV